METCTLCERPLHVKSRGLCRSHYRRWHRYGDPEAGSTFRDMDVEQRLRHWGWTVTEANCWEWKGALNQTGYGILWVTSASLVHRLSYELWVGPIPDGLVIRHKCDNRPCLNPEHLETGTRADNTRDMYERGRQRHLVGEGVASSKLTEQDVLSIRAEYAKGVLTQQMLAESYGVTQSIISSAVLRKTWKHLE